MTNPLSHFTDLVKKSILIFFQAIYKMHEIFSQFLKWLNELVLLQGGWFFLGILTNARLYTLPVTYTLWTIVQFWVA